jgi:hypothetical protein
VLDDNDDVIARVSGGFNGALIKIAGATGIEESRRYFGDKKVRLFAPFLFLEAADGTIVTANDLPKTKKTPPIAVVDSFGPEVNGKKLAVADSAVAPEEAEAASAVKDGNFLVGTRGGGAIRPLPARPDAHQPDHARNSGARPAGVELDRRGKPPGAKGYKYADKAVRTCAARPAR